MELSDWIKTAKETFSSQLDTKIKVVGIIGKDYPDHGKGDNINSYLRENVFPVATSDDETCTISAHYSEDEQILFLVMNGVDDAANIRKQLKTDNNLSYFEAMAQSENQQIRMLHFLFICCHFIIIFEQTSRIDVEFMRFLKRVNAARLRYRRKVDPHLIKCELKHVTFNNRILSTNESEGRVVVPRLLIAFQRNNIRGDVNAAKKRELYEKLEKNLDGQFNDILKSFDLIDSGASSLCQLNETIPCVHLMNPRTVKRDIVSEIFESFMCDIENRQWIAPTLTSNNSFVMFLEENFRSEKNEISLGLVVDLLGCLSCVLDGSIEEEKVEAVNQNPMALFLKRLHMEHLREAKKLYTAEDYKMTAERIREGLPRGIRSKEEHIVRFNEATHYIESVVGNNIDAALTELHAQCDEIWQSDLRACEAVTIYGGPCVKKIHPTFGDLTVPEFKWIAHDAQNTIVSTCLCGKKQLVRQEPFSVKEANCDFYENPEFKCCRRLWRFQFRLYQEDSEEKDIMVLWADRESNSLHAAKKQPKDELADEDDSDVLLSESLLEEEGSDEDARVRTQSDSSSCSDDDMYFRPSSSRREDSAKSEREMCVDFARRLQKLEAAGKSNDFIADVPNSLTAGKLPLFPSFYLTSLGDSSLYSHGNGLKHQPNFKIGGGYLSPVVVHLPVDPDCWNRDLVKFRSEDYSKRYCKEKVESPHVKLFVGFEYECSRGHRFFVDHTGEPLIYPRGSNVVRESAQRCSLGDVLSADLPMRRPCTCRKPPMKSAQLQKIHIVTPKAPVHINLNPEILIPGHQGVYGIGQTPLELHHSKYYILHLPVVYSGPSGIWRPSENSNMEREGIFRGGAIKVVYKPVISFKW